MKYKTYIKAFLFIVILSGLFSFANYRNAERKVNEVEISFGQGHNLLINSEKINKIIVNSVGNIKTKQRKKVDLIKIEKEVEKNKMVEKAEVFLTIDGVLKTKVFQRNPIARILANGTSTYMDDKGLRMPLSDIYSARVPIVTGVQSEKDLKQVYQFITQVLKFDFMKKQIIGIIINTSSEFVLKTRMGNQIIEFGTLKNAKGKVKKLEAFYQKAIQDKSLNTYSKINLKFSKQVVCTKRS